jgi:hypothetical protein
MEAAGLFETVVITSEATRYQNLEDSRVNRNYGTAVLSIFSATAHLKNDVHMRDTL